MAFISLANRWPVWSQGCCQCDNAGGGCICRLKSRGWLRIRAIILLIIISHAEKRSTARPDDLAATVFAKIMLT